MAVRSLIMTLLVSFIATLASLYVAGRLWQDAEIRVYLAKEFDRMAGQVALSGIVVTNDGNAILRELDVAHPAAKALC